MRFNRNTSVAFDVHGTLVDVYYNPRPEIIDLYKRFQELGCYMIVWSGGGRDMAAQWARKLDLRPNMVCLKDMMLQPDIIFDDEELIKPFGKAFIKV
jgi:hypothetical protein